MQSNQNNNGFLTNEMIATDLLIGSKSAIKNYAWALSETASPQVRQILQQQLNDAIDAHSKLTNYMLSKGYYYAYNMESQLNKDIQAAQQLMNLP